MIKNAATNMNLIFPNNQFQINENSTSKLDKDDGPLESPMFDILIKATIRKLLYSFSQFDISIENGDIVTEIYLRK
jgi:hypothetical protein